jgi:hypothetical protein
MPDTTNLPASGCGCTLDPARFDRLIACHGIPVQYRDATRCACYRFQSGVPDPACTICFALGLVWDKEPQAIVAFGPNRKPMTRPDMIGMFDVGDVFFTFQSGFVPNGGGRLTLNAPLVEDDILTRGKEDRIMYPTAYKLLDAFYVVRTPPTGDPYVNSQVFLVPDEDIFLDPDSKRITYASATNPPVGTRVVVQFEMLTEYIVSEVQDRSTRNVNLPYRVLCKRYSSFLHPRDKEKVAY